MCLTPPPAAAASPLIQTVPSPLSPPSPLRDPSILQFCVLDPPLPTSGRRRSPLSLLPVSLRLQAGRLYTVDSSRSNYSSPVQVLKLKGSPAEVGEAYGELLADQIKATYYVLHHF